MTTTDDHSRQESETIRRRRWTPWLLVPAVLGAVVGGALAARVTPVYRSEALVRVVPQPTPESLVPSPTSTDIRDSLQMIRQVTLSRTRLQRLIDEFDLYKEERRGSENLQEIVEHMRTNVEINVAAVERGEAVAFRIGFIGTEPGTVTRVTERLTTILIQTHQSQAEAVAESPYQFLSGQLKDTGIRLAEKHKQLRAARDKRQPEAETLAIELGVLETTFKDRFAKTEESRIAVELVGRQTGGQLQLLEPARLPERPITPDWRAYVEGGSGAGAAVGVLVLLLGPTRYRRESGHAETAASDESPSDGPSSSN